ncbi:MAG TPA: InlB B-repeat-containing protein, partial [Clostridia bacterium]|nr:InlB B-repeat-containing protein [Clostridia bacterium]
MKRFTALALALALTWGLLPINALAILIPTDQYVPSGSFQLLGFVNPDIPTHTYIFMVDGDERDRQIVKNNELLTEPAAPEKADHKFLGWYVGEDKIDFALPVTVSSTETIIATARFQKVYYVFFMDSVGTDARVFKTKEGITGESVSTTDVKPPIASNQALTGWYKDQGLTDGPVGSTYIIGTANQQLWPKIEIGNYLYFVSGDQGTYIEPQFVVPNTPPTAPTPPTRPGYTFKHWSETQGGATPYLFNAPLTADMTIYAVWTANNTNYTVVFWKQSVNDSKNAAEAAKTYDYAESAVRTAASGATVSPTTADGNKNYPNFHYNSGKSVSVVVKGDGTTILNVYYDRNLLTIDFHRNGQSGAEDGEYTGLYGQTLAQNGYTWPSNHRWTQNASSPYGTTLTFLDAFIFDNLTNFGSSTYINTYAQSLSGTAQIIHYKENLDGTWAVANTCTTSGGTFYFTNKYTGFTVYQYRADNGSWRSASPDGSASYTSKLEVRHKRNSYKLAFYNYNVKSREETLLYEAPLSGFASYVPPKPGVLPDEYEFQGWYKDDAFSVPFNFATEIMPSNDLMIYAKWAPPEVIGTVYLTMDGLGPDPVIVGLTYNEPVDPNKLPSVNVPDGYKWIGWATKNGDEYTLWNFDTLVLSDITLYPYYVNNQAFTVTYYKDGDNPGDPPVIIKTDPKTYAQNSYADVMSTDGLTPPAGKVFLGWQNGGVIYQPGDKIKVTGDMTLTAKFGDIPQPTVLTYYYNHGEGAPSKEFTYPINSEVTIKALSDNDLGWSVPANYEFLGWNTNADGSGDSFSPGASAIVDADGSNELYAMWAPVLTVTSGTKSWIYDGNSHTYQQYTLVYGSETITGTEGQTSFTLSDGTVVTITPTGKGLDGVKTVSDNSNNNNTFTVGVAASVTQGEHVFGTLSITALTDEVIVTIKENSGTETYDGTEKTVSGYTVTSISNPLYKETDFTFSGTASVSGKNAGTYNMELKPADFTNNNANFTNIRFVIVDGTLTINPRAVTVTAQDKAFIYTGTAQSWDKYD